MAQPPQERRLMGWQAFTLATCLLVGAATAAFADDQRFGFAVMGDSRGPSNAQQINENVLVALRQQVARLANGLPTHKPEFLVFLGDMSMDGGASQIEAWKSLMQPLPIPYLVTVGNHELYAKDGKKTNRRLEYQDDFARLLNGSSSFQLAQKREDYLPNLAFAFRKGNSLFVILDAYYVDPRKDVAPPQIGYISDDQYDWFRNVLDRASNDGTIKHKFVFAHAPWIA